MLADPAARTQLERRHSDAVATARATVAAGASTTLERRAAPTHDRPTDDVAALPAGRTAMAPDQRLLARVAPPPVLPTVGFTDSLDVEGLGAPDRILRRVTLPRALSRTHRPPSPASPADGIARASTVPSSVVQQLRTSDEEHPQVRRPVTPSVVPAGTGALLDVIRGDAATVVPRGARAGAVTTAPAASAQNGGPLARRTSPPRIQRTAEPVPFDTPTPTPSGPASLAEVPVPAAPAAEPVAEQAMEPAAPAVKPAAEVVADRFLHELSRSIRQRPDPLPTSFRPLAEAIAGPRPVMLSTDAASRRALRSVGKVAATTDATIHLDPGAVSADRLNEVIAHELTHVAAPSPVPRFFDDIDDSPEERRAERVGRVMARSPIAPTASLAGLRGETIRRSPARPPASTRTEPSSGSIRADDLVARYTSPDRATTIRREPLSPTAAAPVLDPPSASAPPPAAAPAPAAGRSASNYSLKHDKDAPQWFREQLDRNLAGLLRMIEDRMIVELERRGGRTWRSL